MTGRQERRSKQILDYLQETRRCWKLKDEALDRTLWRTRFGCAFGPVARRSKWWWRDRVDRSRRYFVSVMGMYYAHPILRLWREGVVGGLRVARQAEEKYVQNVDWISWKQETTEALGVGGRIILKRTLNKLALGRAWTGFIRYTIRTSGRHLWSHYGTFSFRRMRWISWQTEGLLTSEVGLYSVKFRLDLLYCFSVILHINLKCISNPLCRFVNGRINSTTSPASDACNVSEPRLMSQMGRVREVVCV